MSTDPQSEALLKQLHHERWRTHTGTDWAAVGDKLDELLRALPEMPRMFYRDEIGDEQTVSLLLETDNWPPRERVRRALRAALTDVDRIAAAISRADRIVVAGYRDAIDTLQGDGTDS